MTAAPLSPAAARENALDALPALWNTSPDNPAVQARQARSEERTRFQVQFDPEYGPELARLRSWLADYEIPRKDQWQ